MYPNWLSLVQASLVLAELVAAAPSVGSSGVSAALAKSDGISVPPPESRLKTRSTLPEPPVAGQAEAGSESEAETLQRRWTIDSRCSQEKQRTIEAALTSAEAAAKLAADDAKSHDKSAMKRFYAYFGTDSRDYRKEVRERLKAIAKQCGRAKEDPLITCHDVYNRCNKYGIPREYKPDLRKERGMHKTISRILLSLFSLSSPSSFPYLSSSWSQATLVMCRVDYPTHLSFLSWLI